MKDRVHPGINLGADHGEAHLSAEGVVFGFWVFLMSDLIIFGLCFIVYALSNNSPGLAGGPTAKDLFDVNSVLWQTGFLLASSLSFGFASLSMKFHAKNSNIIFWLAVTALLGLGFLFFEVKDLMQMAKKGGVPSRSAWLSSLYALLGLHGLHVSVGILWILSCITKVSIKGLTKRTKHQLLCLGVYWHFLDIIWIGIFSIVFLMGLAL